MAFPKFTFTSLMTIVGMVSLVLPATPSNVRQKNEPAPKSAKSTAPAGCNQRATEPLMLVDLPGPPFQAIPSRNGCWIFVSLTTSQADRQGKIAVLKRSGGQISVARVVPVEGNPTGMALTHDGKLLVVASSVKVAFLDTQRLISGEGDPVLDYWSDDPTIPGRVYVNVTADDRYLFVSDERTQTITVLNLAQARKSGLAAASAIGKIPVGRAPIALTFSPSGRYLYTTSQAMPQSNWPLECKPEAAPAGTAPDHTQGAVLVVDVKRAKSDPAKSVIATIQAGCNPVRLVLSPKGKVAYVTARGSNSLLAFSTRKLRRDPEHALIGKLTVGTAPVGMAVIDRGRKIVVTNSNRFAGGADDRQSLTVVDVTKIFSGTATILGSIPAGAFPREMRLTTDRRTLLLTNFNSRTLEVIDLKRLPIEPLRPETISR